MKTQSTFAGWDFNTIWYMDSNDYPKLRVFRKPPVAMCKNISVPLDATGNASISASQIDDGSSGQV